MASSYHDYWVTIHNLETSEQKVVEIPQPEMCAASTYLFALPTHDQGLHILTHDGDLVQIIPDPETSASSFVAFKLRDPNIMAIGYTDGRVLIWLIRTQQLLSSLSLHSSYVSFICLNLRAACSFPRGIIQRRSSRLMGDTE